MIKAHRCLAVALFALGFLSAGKLSAQSPFDGTWRADLSKTKHEPKPEVRYIAQGWFHCESCDPAYALKADGTDQPVTNMPVDTQSLKIVDDKSVQVVGKKGGKVAYEMNISVSADGKTLTSKGTGYPPNSDTPITFTNIYKRIGTLPAGVHAVSGRWQIIKDEAADNALLTTYKLTGDQFTLTRPTGESYTAKFDEKEYPVKGSYQYDTVALKRVSDRVFQETDKLNGKEVEEDTWTVSPDGKSLTVVAVTKPSGRTDTQINLKVPDKK